MKRFLAVLDFDHTIVDKNSDVVIRNLLPTEVLESAELKAIRQSSWTKYMAEIFRRLPEHGVGKDKVITECENLTPSDGMIGLLSYLSETKADLMVLSDANSVIISSWLAKNVPDVPISVFTNPASWSNDGVLTVEPYHHQKHCTHCAANLCKGSVLKSTRASRTPYDFVLYIGDGKNDLCPSLTLGPCDFVFPRRNFTLEKLIKTNPLKASVHVWSHADEIKEKLSQTLSDVSL